MQLQTNEPLQQIMLARYYSPTLSRFLSRDPGDGTRVEDPQTWNAYMFVENNPMKFVDPDGEETKLITNVEPYAVVGKTADEAWNNARAANPDGFPGHTSALITITKLDTIEAGGGETGEAVSIPTDVDVTVAATISVPSWTAPANAPPGEQKAFDSKSGSLMKHEQAHVAIAKQGGQALETTVKATVGTGQGQTKAGAQANAKSDLQKKATKAQSEQRTATGKKQQQYDKKTDHGRQP